MSKADSLTVTTHVQESKVSGLLELPTSLFQYELMRLLDVQSSGTLSGVSKELKKMCNDERIWQMLVQCDLQQSVILSLEDELKEQGWKKSYQIAVQRGEIRLKKYQNVRESAMDWAERNTKATLGVKIVLKMCINKIFGTYTSVQCVAKGLEKNRREYLATGNKQLYDYCCVSVAEGLVDRADSKIRDNHDAAFPVAWVALQLCQNEPRFTELFLGAMHARCCATMPVFKDKSQYENTVEYQKAMGYKEFKDEEGNDVFEDDDAYLRRMAGFVCLFGAFVQLPCQGSHPHGIEQGLAWLTRVVQQKSKQPANETILLAFLETAGFQLCKTYPDEMQNILGNLKKEYVVTPRASVCDTIIKDCCDTKENVVMTKELFDATGNDCCDDAKSQLCQLLRRYFESGFLPEPKRLWTADE